MGFSAGSKVKSGKRISERFIKQAKEVSILSVWDSLDGLPPISKDNVPIRSPFREDKKPSLQVGGPANIAFDHATGDTWDTIELVKKVKGSTFNQAVAWILNKSVDDLFESNGSTTPDRGRMQSDWPVNALSSWPYKVSLDWTELTWYPYIDENGELLYWNIRFEPPGGGDKTFRPLRIDARGCQEWGLKGVERVLYRLPETLAAVEKGETIFLCEGEKATDSVVAMGFPATTSGSATSWKDEFSKWFAGAKVVILPDNDTDGRSYAEKAARSLLGVAASVKVAELPGLPEKGDAFDWIQGDGTREELLRLVEATREWELGNVEVVSEERPEGAPEWKPFPTHRLPEPVREYVWQAAIAQPCDEALVAVPALVGLGGSIGNYTQFKLKPRRGQCEPPLLWVAIVGDSGLGKTPTLRDAMRPILNRENESLSEYALAYKQFERDVAEHAALKPKQRKETSPPKAPPMPERLLVRDHTIEALAMLLADNPRGLILEADELNRHLAAQGKYTQSKDEPDAWNQIFNAGELTVDRKTSMPKTLHVPVAGVSIVGGIQPRILARAMGEEKWESGYAARFLFVSPPALPRVWTDADIEEEVEMRYSAVFRNLWDRPFRNTFTGDAEKSIVSPSTEALEAWKSFQNRNAHLVMNSEGNIQALFSKTQTYAVRLSLIIHMTRWASGEEVDPSTVDGQSVETGIELAEWFRNEALRVYSILRESPKATKERKVLDWIRSTGTVTARELHKAKKTLFNSSAEAEEFLEKGVDDGRLRKRPRPTSKSGGRPTNEFFLPDRYPNTPKPTPGNGVSGFRGIGYEVETLPGPGVN
jgi:hypothetical protein